MTRLELQGVSKGYGATLAVDDVSLTIEEGEILALLGPSGCGKTTVLRIVAGLEETYEGNVLSDGGDLRGVPPSERDFGMMFQDLALFPHLNVFTNVAFGLRMLGVPKKEQQRRVATLLDLVGLSGKDKRGIFDLSGGERQRVALARSLAPEPGLLMLDEPLGALDRNLRESLTAEIRELLKSLGVSALYVTHDQEEAMTIGDRVAVMNRGRLEQIDGPPDLLSRPASEFVARFMGYENLFPVHSADGEVMVGTFAGPRANPGFEGHLLIPEEAISIEPSGDESGIVQAVRPRGRNVDITLLWQERQAHLEVPTSLAKNLAVGDELRFEVDRSLLHLIPAV